MEAKDLEKGFGKVQKGGEDLLNDADAIGADGQPIADTVNGLGDRLGNLRDRLEDKAEDLKNKAEAKLGPITEKYEKAKGGPVKKLNSRWVKNSFIPFVQRKL